MTKQNMTNTDGEKLIEAVKKKVEPPPMYKVMLNNDDYTPMDFVIEVLVTFFNIDSEKANQLMLAVHYQGALLALSVFILVFSLTRFVSLGSMVAALSFPFIIVLVYSATVPSLIVFSMFVAILVLITHQKNIERLVRKEESKANFSLKNLIRQVGEDD